MRLSKEQREEGWKKCYKVVSLYPSMDCYASAVWYAKPVSYRPGVVTHRPENCGPLACFKTKRSAEIFMEVNGTECRHIFTALYKPSTDNMLWKWMTLNDWCTNEPKRTQVTMADQFPTGTLFADSIMLLEEVTD